MLISRRIRTKVQTFYFVLRHTVSSAVSQNGIWECTCHGIKALDLNVRCAKKLFLPKTLCFVIWKIYIKKLFTSVGTVTFVHWPRTSWDFTENGNTSGTHYTYIWYKLLFTLNHREVETKAVLATSWQDR